MRRHEGPLWFAELGGLLLSSIGAFGLVYDYSVSDPTGAAWWAMAVVGVVLLIGAQLFRAPPTIRRHFRRR